MAIRAGEEVILMGALVKGGLVLRFRVKNVRKNIGRRVFPNSPPKTLSPLSSRPSVPPQTSFASPIHYHQHLSMMSSLPVQPLPK